MSIFPTSGFSIDKIFQESESSLSKLSLDDFTNLEKLSKIISDIAQDMMKRFSLGLDLGDKEDGKKSNETDKDTDDVKGNVTGEQNAKGKGHYDPSVPFDAGPNPEIKKWEPDIKKASALTGIDANVLGGQMWAESRGDASEKINSKNKDGTTDLSLMQIGQERWDRDVMETLTDEDKKRIKEVTGKNAKDLDMSDPHDNVIGGAFELRMHIVEKGGNADHPMDNEKALFNGLKAYVGVDSDSKNTKYAKNVLLNADVLRKGERLDDSQ